MNIKMKDGPTMFMKTKGMTKSTFAIFSPLGLLSAGARSQH